MSKKCLSACNSEARSKRPRPHVSAYLFIRFQKNLRPDTEEYGGIGGITNKTDTEESLTDAEESLIKTFGHAQKLLAPKVI